VKLAVVIAAWNERENLEALTLRLQQTLTGAFEIVYVIAGDDGTRAIAERLQAEFGNIRIIDEPQRGGLGAALRLGFAAVTDDTDLVVTMDADLNHQPEEIPRLLATLERTKADVVVGSRAVSGSTVTGTPLWKRFLSGVLNIVMQVLFGGTVRDKTSGFRVYRADVIRNVPHRQNDYSVQPEIVIEAQRAGYRIVEEPIHFIYRREGQSKMEFWPTSFSYLSLLRGRLDRTSIAAVLIVIAGFVLQLATNYPVHKSPADGDVALMGLCACDILGGNVFKVFYNLTRLGSLECYATAAVFALFGVSRGALAFVAPLLSVFTLAIAYRFFRNLLGRSVALVALFFLAIPSPAVLFWLAMPNSYPMTLLLCAAILWMATRAEQRPATRWTAVPFGLAIGLGFWTSFLTLMCTVPAVLWLAWRRADLRFNVKWLAWLALGFVIGAAPWIAYNVRYPLASFQDNFAARPAGGTDAALANVEYLITYKIPELAASLDPENGVVAPSRVMRVLRVPVLLIWLVAAIWLALRDKPSRRAFWLAAGIAITAVVLNVFSEAGETRGLTVRYVLPLYFSLVIALAFFLVDVARRSRLAAIVIGAIVLAFNISGYRLPGDPYRRELERAAVVDDALVAQLEKEGTQFVTGDYWRTYSINFQSRERIIGVPCRTEDDFRKMAARIPDGATKWVALARVKDAEWIARWMRAAKVAGTTEIVGPYVLFRPARPSPFRPVVMACP
jgi:4-amino-4-deoxy-L-arabinose transferase-like glycosyltransferase/GT2 family glycosyltransferase